MLRRVGLIVLIASLWVRPATAQTEKYANNPLGGAQATLATTITSGGTSIIVSSATRFPTTGTFTILIETEYIICTSVSGTTFTCPTRGSEGSSAVGHTAGVNVYHVITDRSLRNNPLAMTTAGDISYLSASFSQTRLGIGSTGNLLTVSSGLPAWTNSPRLANGITGTAMMTTFLGALDVGLVVQGNGSNYTSIFLAGGNHAFGGSHEFVKTRSADGTTPAIVQSGDALGYINFRGDDGTDFTSAARIRAAVDGTPGVGDMPGRLEFYTTPDGSAVPIERLRINSVGTVSTARLAFSPSQAIDLNGVTTFAATSMHIVLTCTGPESLATITGAESGMRFIVEHDDSDCTILDDDDPTAANAIDLTGSATNDQGATHKLIELFYNGTFFKQLGESDN